MGKRKYIDGLSEYSNMPLSKVVSIKEKEERREKERIKQLSKHAERQRKFRKTDTYKQWVKKYRSRKNELERGYYRKRKQNREVEGY